jgi:hypothetical protein
MLFINLELYGFRDLRKIIANNNQKIILESSFAFFKKSYFKSNRHQKIRKKTLPDIEDFFQIKIALKTFSNLEFSHALYLFI